MKGITTPFQLWLMATKIQGIPFLSSPPITPFSKHLLNKQANKTRVNKVRIVAWTGTVRLYLSFLRTECCCCFNLCWFSIDSEEIFLYFSFLWYMNTSMQISPHNPAIMHNKLVRIRKIGIQWYWLNFHCSIPAHEFIKGQSPAIMINE